LEELHIGDDITRRKQLIDETNAMKYDPKTSFIRFLNKLNKNLNSLEFL